MTTNGRDVEARRARLVRVLGYFPTVTRAAKALGLPSTTLARATSGERVDTRALADVEAVLDRMDADFTRIGKEVPVGHPLSITLPDGHRVTGIVSRLVPRDGTPWADVEVLGPNLFDAERSGTYVADLLRFEALGDPDADS